MSSLPPEPAPFVAEIAAPAPRVSDPPRPSRPSLRPPEPAKKETLRDRLVATLFALVRDPNPILLKEFRATLRTPLFVRMLYVLTGMVALLVVGIGAAFGDESYVTPANVGQGLFQTFFSIIAFTICLFVPAYSATAITSERETRTYESLVLSDMSATRIILGKFFAYFGSAVLILIAVSPVISIAFLFGGVSPSGVLVAFISTLVLLAVATSFGIAVSARLENTRMAILGGLCFLLPSFFGLLADLGLGEIAGNTWSTSFEGPFWFALALPEVWKQLDALVGIAVFPLATAGAMTWFLLASAVVGIRHPGEDRSTPLKIWAAVTAPAAAIVIGGSAVLLNNTNDAELGVVIVIFATMAGAFIGFVFANEPPLPPRARKSPTLLSRLLAPIGPGAAGTTRFALVVSVIPPLLTALIFVTKAISTSASVSSMESVVMAAFGGACLVLSLTAVAEAMRLLVGNGLVARLLTIILFVMLILGPTSISVVLDVNGVSNALIPVMLSPIGLLVEAVRVSEGASFRTLASSANYVIPALASAFYAFLAFVTWVGIEVFVQRAKKRDEAARASHVSAG